MVGVSVQGHLPDPWARPDSETDAQGGGGGPDPAILHSEVTLLQNAPGDSENKEMSGDVHQQSHGGLPEESSWSQFLIKVH